MIVSDIISDVEKRSGMRLRQMACILGISHTALAQAKHGDCSLKTAYRLLQEFGYLDNRELTKECLADIIKRELINAEIDEDTQQLLIG